MARSRSDPEIEDRAVQGDLITGSRNKAPGTLVERTTRFTILLHLPDGHDCRNTSSRPSSTRCSTSQTCQQPDLGLALHKRIGASLDIMDSLWQRHQRENTNGLLRQYFPKGTDLRLYRRGRRGTQRLAKNLGFTEDHLNGRRVITPTTDNVIPLKPQRVVAPEVGRGLLVRHRRIWRQLVFQWMMYASSSPELLGGELAAGVELVLEG